MGSDSLSSPLTDRDVTDIQLLFEIARVNGARLSLIEAVSLLRPEISKEDIASALNDMNGLNKHLRLQSGLFFAKEEALAEASEVEAMELRRMSLAERNLAFAFDFAAFSGGAAARVFSVSGSSSYGSISSGDDLDFFCITPSETLWLFITRQLILARIFRAFNQDTPSICLSCMMDEGYARRSFKLTRDALFARDALHVSIIHGHDFYGNLLRESAWLSEYFPKLYRERLSGSRAHPAQSHGDPNVFTVFVNQFVFRFVGNYLRLKAYLSNRRLTRDKRNALLFTAKIGKDHCIYESVRYSDLRPLYSRLARRGETDAIALHS